MLLSISKGQNNRRGSRNEPETEQFREKEMAKITEWKRHGEQSESAAVTSERVARAGRSQMAVGTRDSGQAQ